MTTEVAPNSASSSPSTPNPTGEIKVSAGEGSSISTPPPASGSPADWTSGLNDELKGFVQHKQFKDVPTVVESYRQLEKLVGLPKDRLLKLPEKSDDPQWNEIYAKLGRPENADGYKIAVPKEGGDENFAKWAKETFHKSNLTAKQAETLAAKWNEYASSQQEQVANAQKQKVEAENNSLKQEWGAAYEQNTNIARRAVREFGMDEATIDKLESALGFAGVMKFLNTVGSKLGEDTFVSGDSKNTSFAALTPAGAQARLAALKSDEAWTAKYLSGDIEAKQEMDRLHQMAYNA